MDPKISRIVAGTVYGVQPNLKKKPKDQPKNGSTFSLEKGSPNETAPTSEDEAPEHEHLPVSKPQAGEAGGQLDLTA